MIGHMLDRNEDRRWSAAQLLEHEWFEVALTSPAAALGLHMVKRLQVFSGMNRWVGGGAAGGQGAAGPWALLAAGRWRWLGRWLLAVGAAGCWVAECKSRWHVLSGRARGREAPLLCSVPTFTPPRRRPAPAG